jgi:hypothetical protein
MRKWSRVTTLVEKKRELGVNLGRPFRSNYLLRDAPLLSIDSLLAIIQVLRSYELTI